LVVFFCLASIDAVKPQASAKASATVRNFMFLW
jgi:hypothetical protein